MKTSDSKRLSAFTLLALVFLVSIDEYEAQEKLPFEPVKTIVCSSKYNKTTLPNIFGHTTQEEAIVYMHTFSPLINTFCSDDLALFACSVFLPKYGAPRRPCQSFCKKVYDNCTYAIDQLQFKWPEIISCENLPRSDCYVPVDSTQSPIDRSKGVNPLPTKGSAPFPTKRSEDGCSATIRQPMCSKVVTPSGLYYFAEVNEPFTNYFNHTSQDQAVFEFSQHNIMLVNLIATYENTFKPSQQGDQADTTVKLCLQDLVYLLCTLYVPRCGEKKPADYGITRGECENTLGTTCSSAIRNLQNLGYNLNVKWPPVSVNCRAFSNKRIVSHSFKPITFLGLVPPPPAVRVIGNGPDFMWIAWDEFPATFSGKPLAMAGLLYKVYGSKTPYIHRDYKIDSPRLVRLDNLKTNTTYDVFLGSVDQNKAYLPGPFVRLQLKTDIADRVSTPFCTEYYNFTIFPNAFGDENEADAIFRMHTFFPLFDTMCSKYLKAFICSAFLPRYDLVSKAPQKPCASLCSDVFDSCRYAIERLKFKWPEELKCTNLPLDVKISCFKPPKTVSKDVPLPECTTIKEQSICSVMTATNGQPYFSSVKKDFTNYFKHTSQEQAVYELSKYATLLSLFASLRSDLRISSFYPATRCIYDISFFLCTLHFPTCGGKGNQYQITKGQCEDLVDSAVNGKCSVRLRQAISFGYSIKWPPVNVNCDDFIQADKINLGINYNQITFNNSIPPPAALRYTKSNSTTATWQWSRNYPKILSDENGVEFLYKPAGSETTFSHHHVPKGNTYVLFNAFSLNKRYEVFVGVLDGKTKLPGRLRRIDYIHGTSVFDIPSHLDLCYRNYKQTVLPNVFGDQTIEEARLGMHKFFPLVYTLCSERLTRLLCSVFLPPLNAETYSRKRPCKSACEEIYRDCLYAIDRARFFWPPEMKCDQFDNEESCDGLEETNLVLSLGELSKRSPALCKPTPRNRICGAILQSGDGFFPMFSVTLNFAAGETNYFNHTSKDEAIYELSRHLPLLSSLGWTKVQQSGECLEALMVLLCHLHLPGCPLNTRTVTQNLCLQIMNTSTSDSICHFAVRNMQKEKVYFEWPPVQVNCFDRKWFGINATLGKVYVSPQRFPRPPPKNIRVKPLSSRSLSVQVEPFFHKNYSTELVEPLAILYREDDTFKPYGIVNVRTRVSFSLASLAPGKDYEVKVATVFPTATFPGPFNTLVNNTYGLCQAETTGDNVTQGLFFWKTTDPSNGKTYLVCPYGPTAEEYSDDDDEEFNEGSTPFLVQLSPLASRRCICTDVTCKNPKWDKPITSVCSYKTFNDSDTTQHLSGLLQFLQRDQMNAVNVSEKLVNLTANTTEFQEEDVELALIILEDIVNNLADLSETGPNIVKTVNNILNVDSGTLRESQINTNSSTRYLSLLNQYLENVPIEYGDNVTQEEGNLAIHAQEFRVKNFEGAGAASFPENKVQENFVVYDKAAAVQPLSSQASLTIPKSLFEALNIESKDQKKRLYFAVFRKTLFFQSLNKNASNSDNKTIRKKNSFVIAGSVKGGEIRNLTDPVVTAYYPLDKAIDESVACVFWDFGLKNGLGDWSTDGCYYEGTTDGLVTCNCNHLTNYAILMDVYIDDHNEDVHDKALSIISYIGCAVSLVGLILTILTILIFKELRSKAPTQILLNFCIALSFTLIVFLIAAERSKTSSMASCRAGAVALHYFLLVAFMWMAIEAFNMYLAFVKVMPSHFSRYMLKCCLAGWGLPAIVVIITAAVAIEDYGDEHFCRLRGVPFQVAFLAPVLIILIGNSVMFVLIFRALLISGKNVAADRKVDGLRDARRGAAILVVLGLTWLFGVLAIKDAKLPFQYLFCIFNAFQGLLVFVFYCLLSVDTRAKYRKLLCGKDDRKYSVTRKMHHGTDSRFHETPTSQNTRSNVTDSIEFATIKSNHEKDEVA